MESTSFKIEDISTFKRKARTWASQFPVCCALDSNEYPDYPHNHYDFILAVDANERLELPIGNAFSSLEKFRAEHPGWIFGYLSYDLKNENEDLQSANPDRMGFPGLFFFTPRYLLYIREGMLYINRNYPEAADLYHLIMDIEEKQHRSAAFTLRENITKEEYIKQVNKILQYIREGEVYEMNYCRELFADDAIIFPPAVYEKLNGLSGAPFSAYFKADDKYILSASPERFLSKQKDLIISQPIKGTARRGRNEEEDLLLKQELQGSEKERAENVMIVDLVRNDLTQSAIPGSIEVEELFGIYTFKTVHQMISTVIARAAEHMTETEIIRHAFPMGSMTGAPKIRAMQLIEELETSRRGVFSGAIGYFAPDLHFDFNVVIRTILYDQNKRKISIHSGGAITIDSDPEQEWAEMQLKSNAMRIALS